MALEAGRVGVRKDQVDSHGRIKSSGGETDPAVTQLQEQVGTYSFRTNPEDGSAQYKQSDTSDWVNFSSGGGVSPVLLWENNNITGDFPVNTTIPIDMNQYTHFIIECQPNKSNFIEGEMTKGLTLVPKIIGILGYFNANGGRSDAYSYSRQGYFTNDGVRFHTLGVMANTNVNDTSRGNNIAVPTKIYGINLDL